MADKMGGWVGWVVKRLRGGKSARPRLTLLERIVIGPRQTVALIEAEGQSVLIACSPEGSPAFYPLHSRVASMVHRHANQSARQGGRVSS